MRDAEAAAGMVRRRDRSHEGREGAGQVRSCRRRRRGVRRHHSQARSPIFTCVDISCVSTFSSFFFFFLSNYNVNYASFNMLLVV